MPGYYSETDIFQTAESQSLSPPVFRSARRTIRFFVYLSRQISRSPEKKPRRPDGARSLAVEVGLKLRLGVILLFLFTSCVHEENGPRLLWSSSIQASVDSGGHRLRSDPSCHAPGPPPRPASDPVSLKLLHHLRSRIRELRAEGQSSPFPAPPRQASDLSGSYLETVRPLAERTQTTCPLVS